MSTAAPGHSTSLRKLFLCNHGAGLVVGACFPFVVYAMPGDKALIPAFFMVCLLAGFVLGAASFWFVRQELKKQLREQLDMLHELLGEDVYGHSG